MAAQELAVQVGVAPACDALGVSRATFYRRRRPTPGHQQPRPTPARALRECEREHVLDVLACPRFVDRSPGEVVATLLDEGQYLCSERTMYRVLAANQPVRERRNQREHPQYSKPELVATGPNQTWSWDVERHEALSDRAAVRDRRGPAVAAAGYKLRAARTGGTPGKVEAALTKPGRGGTVRCRGLGERTRKV